MREMGQGVLIIEVEPSEDSGLREYAKACGPAGHVADVSGRSPDLVLVDHMDNDAEAFAELGRYASQKRYEAGFGHERGLVELEELLSGLSRKVDGAHRDAKELERFGGDGVAMELERDVFSDDLSGSDEELLGLMSVVGRPSDELNAVEEALAALREDVGMDAVAEVLNISDGVVVLMVSTPLGDASYGYDLKSGTGEYQ